MDNLIMDVTIRLMWADSLEVVEDVLRESLGQMGLPCWAFAILDAEDKPLHLATTYPEAWVRHYLDSGYVHIDPVVAEAKRNNLPFSWRFVTNRSSLTAEQRAFFADAAEHGISDGYTLAFAGRNGTRGILSIAFDSSDKIRQIMGMQPKLRVLGLYCHAAFERLLDPDWEDYGLTGLDRQDLGALTESQPA